MSISDDDLPPGIIRSRPRSAESQLAASPPAKPAWETGRTERPEREARSTSPWKSGRADGAKHSGRSRPRPEADPDLHFDPVGKAREDAYFFLSYSDRSEKELVDRLRKRQHSDEVIDEVLAHLRTEGYLNDANYARRWVESRGKTRGTRALSFELKRKGIEGEIAQEALAERGDDDADRAAAWLAATRRAGEPPTDTSPAAQKRLSAFLQRRGFSYATVRSVMRELFAGGDETVEELDNYAD